MGLLRFILALTVVIAHSGPVFGYELVGGKIAVQAFYIISGFYMTLILNEKYIGANNSYKLFLSNRLLRLFPIYWVVLALVIVYSILSAFYTNGSDWGSLNFYNLYKNNLSGGSFLFLIFVNIFLVFQDVVVFLGLNTSSGNFFYTSDFWSTEPLVWKFILVPQAWTIGLEIMFYIIAPFLVRKNIKLIVLLIIGSILLRCFLYFGLDLRHDPWTYRFFPTELVFFLSGTVSYHLYKRFRSLEVKDLFLKIIWILVLAFTVFYGKINFEFKELLYLLFFFISLPFVFILTKNSKRDLFIGELSYPIYISHFFFITIMKSSDLPFWGGFGLNVCMVTILFAFVLNKLVAKKIEKVRQSRILKQVN